MRQHNVKNGKVTGKLQQFPWECLTLAWVAVSYRLAGMQKQRAPMLLQNLNRFGQHPFVLHIEPLTVRTKLSQSTQPSADAAVKFFGITRVKRLHAGKSNQ